MKLRYWIPDLDLNRDLGYGITISESVEDGDVGIYADDCAIDFHNEHDGWESSWPLTFHVQREGGVVQVFEIEREARPVFVARPIAK